MKTMQQWLDEYTDSHRHPTNKTIHWICVPLILFSVLGLLWLLPVPAYLAETSPWLNWATLAAAASVAYYLMLSPTLAVGMALVMAVMFTVIARIDAAPAPLWAVCVVVFIGAWIGQFIGHNIEGKRPSFYKDMQFLLIGPAWLMADAYRRAGIKI